MKNKLLLFVLTLTTVGYAQSLRLLDKDTVDVTNTVVSVAVSKNESKSLIFSIHNKSPLTVSYWVSRTVLSPKELNSCTELGCGINTTCFQPNSLSLWIPDTTKQDSYNFRLLANEIAPSAGSNNNGPQLHYIACADECQDVTVLYKFYNTAFGTNDTSYLTLNYKCTKSTTAINELSNTSAALSAAYPNPAHGNFIIPYELNVSDNSKLAIYDVVGNKLKEIILEQKQGAISFDASQFTPGIYFYSLWLNEQRMITKKLIIE